MPTDVSAMLNSPCGTAVRVLLDNIWSDVIDYVMRKEQQVLIPGDSMGVELFWQHLAVDKQTLIEDFVVLKMVERNEQSTLTADLVRACTRLFHPSQKDVVKCLCVQLEYIIVEHQTCLGAIRNDVDHDPLDFFDDRRAIHSSVVSRLSS